MIAARAMLGFSAGNVAVWRSYVASATTLKERTFTMANINICASAGFVLGPVLQAAFVPISYPGPMEHHFLHVNMYTTPALLATVLCSVSALLILIVFKEHRIKDEPGAEAASIQFLPSQKASIDYVAVFTCILHFFSSAITFQIFQTVSERALLMTGFLFTAAACFVFVPFGQKLPPRGMAPIRPLNLSRSVPSPWMEYPNHMVPGAAYQYTHESNVEPSGTKTAESINNFPKTKANLKSEMHQLEEKEDERINRNNPVSSAVKTKHRATDSILRVGHESSTLRHHRFSRIINYFSRGQRSKANSETFGNPEHPLPWDKTERVARLAALAAIAGPFLSPDSSSTPPTPVHPTTPKDEHEAEGCPWNLSWCAHVPVLHLAQYAVGTLLYGIGYPLCHVLTFTIFSKVLGSKPQGLWMGIFAASGSLAGMTGPVLISHVYDRWGPRVAFTGCTAFLLVVILYSFAVIHRLIPLSQRQKQMGPLTVD
ncbi:major facilitator superfamily domain-containing protein 8 [Elysia marginata]|uniref:Major facilitator superfamily domain-containing protein 8 n=1 Tax=Elysia marginata TaxID=1093978 RepID=A0AAV4JMU8_9GAST|nr:major facilitator superfamily domain-containing protein 8 [Elysia marginata]